MSDGVQQGAEPVTGHPPARGTNQSGMRANNEKLILSLIRRHGALAKSDLTRLTGLSAQTISVIIRALESDGLLMRGEPVRGRIGQPSVPMSLDPHGVYFFGLKIGRRSVDLVLVDFHGRTVAFERRTYRYPTPDAVVDFVAAHLPAMTATLPRDRRGRIAGLGIAMPFQLWNWVRFIGAPQVEMDQWRERDIGAEIEALTGLPVLVHNDATAACSAELVFGTGEKPQDFLYYYVGYFIGGGLVLGGRLFTGRTGNAAGLGPMPVPGPDGTMRRLMEVASLSTLARMVETAGGQGDQFWETPDGWDVDDSILQDWIEGAAAGLASTTLGAATLLELDGVVIDGWIPDAVRARLTERTNTLFHTLDLSGIDPPLIMSGTVGPQARALGGAAIALSQRYLVD